MCSFDLSSIILNFETNATFVKSEPCSSGHINDTFVVTMRKQNGNHIRLILQRINHNVFRNPTELMENIRRVTEYLCNRKQFPFQQRLKIIPAKDHKTFVVDSKGNYWRVFNYIDGARTYDDVTSTKQAYEGAKAFGLFQLELADFPCQDLYETIPNFHNTPKRYRDFEESVSVGLPDRIAKGKDEIEQARQLKPFSTSLTDLIDDGAIPLRVTHNDTKLSNVMLDEHSHVGVCVIDLDTVMQGSSLYDFGDYVRSVGRIGAEDEEDIGNVSFSVAMYEASLQGYLESSRKLLNKVEKENLAVSAIVMTYEVGLRFLTDYLLGDIYFKTRHENHNLDRARVQFKVAKEMCGHRATLDGLVKKYDLCRAMM